MKHTSRARSTLAVLLIASTVLYFIPKKHAPSIVGSDSIIVQPDSSSPSHIGGSAAGSVTDESSAHGTSAPHIHGALANTGDRDWLDLRSVKGVSITYGYPRISLPAFSLSRVAKLPKTNTQMTLKFDNSLQLRAKVVTSYKGVNYRGLGLRIESSRGPASMFLEYDRGGELRRGMILAEEPNFSYLLVREDDGKLSLAAVERNTIQPDEQAYKPSQKALDLVIATGGAGEGQGEPFEYVPDLQSFSGAPSVVYLDFDGHSTTGTAWNPLYGPLIQSPAASLSPQKIEKVWQSISELYRPFTVNVTTNVGVFNQAPPTKRTRIVFTSNTFYPSQVGGLAFRDSFIWESDTPGFVFVENLGFYPSYIAQAAGHEIGHTLGLVHDGRGSYGTAQYQEYYGGHNDWVPLMGSAFDKRIVQFSRGEYAGATNVFWNGSTYVPGALQDDIALITSKEGVKIRADDAGNSFGSAAPLIVQGNALVKDHIIASSSDVDTFYFDVAAPITLWGSIKSASWGFGQLRLQGHLLSSAGTVIAATESLTPFDAAFSPLQLAAGRYFLEVRGVGVGNPSIDGFSNYGSEGSAAISLSTEVVPTPTATSTATPTITETPSPTPTHTATATTTTIATNTPNPTPTNTATPSPTSTVTASTTATSTPTSTPTATATATSTPSPTPTSTIVQTATPTSTPTTSSSDIQIIDDGDAGFVKGARWNPGPNTGLPYYQGDHHYLYGPVIGGAAQWIFTVSPGTYRVSVTYLADGNRATNATYKVLTNSAELATAVVNQEIAPNDRVHESTAWKDIATVTVSGTNLTVQLDGRGNDYLIADAVLIERIYGESVPTPTPTPTSSLIQIVNDGDVGFTKGERWNRGGNTGLPYYQLDHHYIYGPMVGGASQWNFTVSPGTYRVSVTYLPDANRATNASYRVLANSAELATAVVNQEIAPNDFEYANAGWKDIATVSVSGTNLVIQLDGTADEYLIADAVLIERINDEGTPTPTPTSAPTESATATSTATPTATSTFTSSATPTRTATPTATETSTPLPTSTLTPTATPTASATPTFTATATNTPTSTATPTPTSGSNGGQGTFITSQSVTSAVAVPFRAIAAADFDLDGKTDLIVGGGDNFGNIGAELFRGLGNGTFSSYNAFRIGELGVIGGVAGDFNNDGKPDFLWGGSGRIDVRLGLGNGTFFEGGEFPLPGYPYGSRISSGDIDGDGDIDIAAAYQTGGLTYILNNGDGTFAAPIIRATENFSTSVELADIDGDGKVDAVTTGPDGTYAYWNSNGVLGQPQWIANAHDTLGVGDLDNNGLLDIVTSTGPSYWGPTPGMRVVKQTSARVFQQIDYHNLAVHIHQIVVRNIDGDGKMDVVATQRTQGKVLLFKGDGTATLSAPSSIGTFPVLAASSLAFGDFNNDSAVDIASSSMFGPQFDVNVQANE